MRCSLCPRRCEIRDGEFGFCGTRRGKDGGIALPFYGRVTALALDPIEKKPLFHFRPGSMVFSIGFAGCNLRCPFCQNWRISHSTGARGDRMTPDNVVSAARDSGSRAIAYTYSEPLVHAEFLLDCMALARKRGIANVLVTNGCAGAEAADEILSLADAASVDLKCFSPGTYAQTLAEAGAYDPSFFDAVLAFVRQARAKNVHVELVTLVVPGMNDSAEELDACADFVAQINAEPGKPEAPWHLSAYHPACNWRAPPTDATFLLRAKERAGAKLRFVYAGNVPGEENNTLCPCCDALLVRRAGRLAETLALAPPQGSGAFFRCARCGGETGIVR